MKLKKDLWFMFLLTTVCTVVLVGAEQLYQKKLADDPVLMRRILRLAGTEPTTDADVRSQFHNQFEIGRAPAGQGLVYRSRRQKGMLVREEEGPGLWGTIGLLVAYDAERDRVAGLEVLSHSETPGLGARIEEPGFLAQFKALAAGRGVRAAKIRFRDGEFDAISGATMTSKAVEEIVNRAVGIMRQAAAENQQQAVQQP